MDFSIVIPVFNKAELTRNCLASLPPSLEGAGQGEVIVVDNASSDATADVLAEFPWVRVIRNERNLGFAAANNQGARAANGEFLVLLNNDTQALPGWLQAMLAAAREPDVGMVGARLLYGDRTVQHAGVVVNGTFFGRASFCPWHNGWKKPADDPSVSYRRDFQIVTAACAVTRRAIYRELGGLDEAFWNGYEDVDFCLRLRERGMRIVYEPAATLFHLESQSGSQRFRRVWQNVALLEERWHGRVALDGDEPYVAHGRIRRLVRSSGGSIQSCVLETPATTIVVHGDAHAGRRAELDARLRATRSPIAAVRWCSSDEAVGIVRDEMRVRGDRYLALVRADGCLEADWLDELVMQIEALPTVGAAAFVPELPLGENVALISADARCTLLSLRQFPADLELGAHPQLDDAVGDLLLRAAQLRRATRGVPRSLGTLGPPSRDLGADVASPAAMERVLRSKAPRRRNLVSIVTLSWNAPSFTKGALQSIAARTPEPYEVIVVDNGSASETRAMLAEIDDPHVRILYNETNRGYAGGNNDGIAVSRGDFVVLLNNDVIVTDGWLDGLLDPFRRIPALGVTAPRSNLVAGSQQLPNAVYDTEAQMHAFAASRRETWAKTGFIADRAIGLCLCIDRVVLEQIGGLDERFGLGNFEDDDFCLRVRAAGYGIYVCEDVFIHHFGSRSFAANNVDYTKTMHENWSKFAQKWGFSPSYPANGYEPRQAYVRGFDRRKHFVPLAFEPPAEIAQALPARRTAGTTFFAGIAGENEWSDVAEFVKRFSRAFRPGDDVLLSIAAFGDPCAETIASRVERILRRAGVDLERCPDVEISDEDDAQAWRAAFESEGTYDIAALADRSPSALRRLGAKARA